VRRALLAALLATIALGAAGCAVQGAGPEQLAARAAVERHLTARDGYDLTDIHCTGNPRPWFVEARTSVYICAVQRDDGDCDWFRVTAAGGSVVVMLEARHAGCVLPM